MEGDFVDAVRSALRRVEGTFSAAFIHQRFPNCIVVARRGSPLILGLGEGENFVASGRAGTATAHPTDGISGR